MRSIENEEQLGILIASFVTTLDDKNAMGDMSMTESEFADELLEKFMTFCFPAPAIVYPVRYAHQLDVNGNKSKTEAYCVVGYDDRLVAKDMSKEAAEITTNALNRAAGMKNTPVINGGRLVSDDDNNEI